MENTQAANYLADAEGLREAALLLSQRVLTEDTPRHRLTQVLGGLSGDVVRQVLIARKLPLAFLLAHLPQPYHADVLRTSFPSAEALHYLEFLGYNWKAETTLYAMHALPALTTVTCLKVALRADLNTPTRAELSTSVMRAVASMPALKALTLSELCMSDRRAVADLRDESASGDLQLNTLLFFNCGISFNVRSTLSEFIRTMPSLECLEFNASRSHDLFGGLVQSMTAPLLALTKLVSLQISGQSLTQDEVAYMALCLGSLQDPPLRNLYLPFNSIQSAGAQALAESLSVFKDLERLDLTRNTIGVRGAEAIAACLPLCSHLLNLDFWANGVSDAGAQALSRSLISLPSLMFLDLCLNRITDVGAVALADGLAGHPTLKWMNLDNNLIRDEGALVLAGVLTGLRNFGTLFLCRNRLSDEGKLAVESVLQNAVRVENYAVRVQDALL